MTEIFWKMKKYLLLVISFLSIIQINAQDSTFVIPLKKWNLKIIGFNHIYPTYLADPGKPL